jgi:hypothetical protein
MHPAAEFLWHGIDEHHLLAGHPTAAVARDGLRRVFRAVDDGVGELVASLPADAAVVVFSLNGIRTGPGDTPSGALLPEFLSRWYTGRALLAPDDSTRWRASGCPPVAPGPCQKQGYFNARRNGMRRRDKALQRALESLPDRAWPVQHALRRAVMEPRGRRLGPMGMVLPDETEVDASQLAAQRIPFHQIAEWYQPHWHDAPAFALPSFAHGYVRLNVIGREANGLVDVADYDRVIADLTHELLRCTSPRDGRPVVREVVRTRVNAPDDVFDASGPYADLIVVWEDCVDAFEHPATGLIGPFPLQRVAGHSRNGFAHVRAPGLEAGDGGRHAAVTLPATIRLLLGAPAGGTTLLDDVLATH